MDVKISFPSRFDLKAWFGKSLNYLERTVLVLLSSNNNIAIENKKLFHFLCTFILMTIIIPVDTDFTSNMFSFLQIQEIKMS